VEISLKKTGAPSWRVSGAPRRLVTLAGERRHKEALQEPHNTVYPDYTRCNCFLEFIFGNHLKKRTGMARTRPDTVMSAIFNVEKQGCL
jgi:hypothetical protein